MQEERNRPGLGGRPEGAYGQMLARYGGGLGGLFGLNDRELGPDEKLFN